MGGQWMWYLLWGALYERAREATRREPTWVYWAYTPEEWQQVDYKEWQRVKRRLLIFLILTALGALYLSNLAWAAADNHTGRISLVPVLLIMWSTLNLVYAGAVYVKSRRFHSAERQDVRHISIGPLMIVYPGGTISLVNPANFNALIGLDPFSPPMHALREVRIDPDNPQVLSFGGWAWGGWLTSVRVPIPSGHEAEAQQLITRFQQDILLQAPPLLNKPAVVPPSNGRLPRPWYGGTKEAQRYGPSAHRLQAPETPVPTPEHNTQQLTPPDSK